MIQRKVKMVWISTSYALPVTEKEVSMVLHDSSALPKMNGIDGKKGR